MFYLSTDRYSVCTDRSEDKASAIQHRLVVYYKVWCRHDNSALKGVIRTPNEASTFAGNFIAFTHKLAQTNTDDLQVLYEMSDS